MTDQATEIRFYSAAGIWMKASNEDCLVWDSFPIQGESVTWSGNVAGGKASGRGILQWFTNGVAEGLYEGEMENGLYDGHGISRVSKKGASWEGDWEKGRLVSKTMTCFYETGGWYKGEQKGGFKDGQGEEMMTGGKYIGQFRHDKFEGQGEMLLLNGDTITGAWSDSKLVGAGTYTTSSGQSIKVKMTDKGIVNF